MRTAPSLIVSGGICHARPSRHTRPPRHARPPPCRPPPPRGQTDIKHNLRKLRLRAVNMIISVLVSAVEYTGGAIARGLARRVFIDLAENASEDILRNVASHLATMGLPTINSRTMRNLFRYIGQENV